MENLDKSIEANEVGNNGNLLYTLSVNQYAFLAIITFGLYNIWWMYKSWDFFRIKENSGILAAVRALFAIIFLIPLFQKILKLAKSQGYESSYAPVLLFIGYLVSNLSGYLPVPFFLVAVLSFVFILPPFIAFNYAMMHTEGFEVVEQEKFNGRQIFLMVAGGIFWILMLIGLLG